MTLDIVRFGFVAGELSPNYHFRSDLEKFDLALSLGENYFVDYRGGLSTRPGTEFIDYIEHDDQDCILVPFRFASNIENTNMVLFGDRYIRIVQDGAYVLEAPYAISACNQGNPATITAVGNNFAIGDWVKVFGLTGMNDHEGQLYRVGSVGNTFNLTDVYGNAIDSTNFPAYVVGGSVARTVKVTSPYEAEDLVKLKARQIRDVIRLTHPNYPIYNLRRNSESSWTFELEALTNGMGRPTALTGSTAGVDTFGTLYQVTAVDLDGNESLPSNILLVTNAQDPTTIPFWSYTVNWTAVPNAVHYKVYRGRIIADELMINAGMEVGFIGKTAGVSFVDQFITPNFTLTPPRARNPFANGTIQRVDVATPGDGYPATAWLSATDPNPAAAGFVGLLVINALPTDATRPIAGVIILDGGHDYTNPTFVINAPGAGTGATFTAQVSSLTGNYPSLSAVFQQRQLYFATENNPLGIEGSKPGLFSNFDQGDIINSDDSYGYELDSEDASPILHAVDTRGGLLLITASGIWQFSSGGTAGVTPSNGLADPQTYKGATNLSPLKIDTAIIYAEPLAVKHLTYNDNVKVYSGVDIALLANHMITLDKQLTSWAYADEPFKLIKSVREDGTLLTTAVLRDQDVNAWTRYTTRGKFKYIATLQEDIISTAYTIVERFVGGRLCKYLEKFSSRMFNYTEDAFCLDAGLQLSGVLPNATITLSAVDGDITITADSSIFTAADLDKVFRGGGGKGYVLEVLSTTELSVRLVRPVTNIYNQITPAVPHPQLAGEWTLDTPTTTLYGLRHLEGQTIKVLADGQVVNDLVVTNARVTLPKAATRAIAGFGYTCLGKTLPPVTPQGPIEGKRKRPVGIVMRVKDSLGLKVGTDPQYLYPAIERTDEHFGEPINLQEGTKVAALEGHWTEDAPVYFIQEDPLPATILGYVVSTEIGDDDD